MPLSGTNAVQGIYSCTHYVIVHNPALHVRYEPVPFQPAFLQPLNISSMLTNFCGIQHHIGVCILYVDSASTLR